MKVSICSLQMVSIYILNLMYIMGFIDNLKDLNNIKRSCVLIFCDEGSIV